VTIIWSGLTLGAIYVLVASGYNLVLASSGVLNFTLGATVMAGAFGAYYGVNTLHLPSGVLIVGVAAFGLCIGLVSEVVCIRPLQRINPARRQSSSDLITTVGLATVLEGAATIAFGPNPLSANVAGTGAPVDVLGGFVTPLQLVTMGVAIVVAVGLHIGLRRTRWGLACLAVAEDQQAAISRGINAKFLSIASFGVAGAIAGLAGVLAEPTTFAYTGLADVLAISGFVAVALGGELSQLGGLGGGFLIGLVGAEAGRYLGANYTQVAVFALLFVTLLVRPNGVGGTAAVRDV
jgi:branched-chain amino acid transport system permease protein